MGRKLGQDPVQYACLPFRAGPGGAVEIMLVTSRETGRWVLPKGWPMPGKRPHAAAAREALEEAGLVGKVRREPIGSYTYTKRLRTGLAIPTRVEVFPLAVRAQRKRWREKGQRELRWFDPAEAAGAVAEPELRDLLLRAEELVDCQDCARKQKAKQVAAAEPV